MSINWIFFDVGGVLLDEAPLQEWKEENIVDLALTRGHLLTREDVRRAWTEASGRTGSLAENAIDILVPHQKDAKAIKHELRMRHQGMEKAAAEQAIRPDAHATVEALSKRFSLGLLANQPFATKIRLRDAGLLTFFSSTTVSADTEYQKPDPLFFQEILKRTDARGERSVIVDDNIERGLAPAKQLGMTTVWMKTAERTDIPEGIVDFTITRLSELLELKFK